MELEVKMVRDENRKLREQIETRNSKDRGLRKYILGVFREQDMELPELEATKDANGTTTYEPHDTATLVACLVGAFRAKIIHLEIDVEAVRMNRDQN